VRDVPYTANSLYCFGFAGETFFYLPEWTREGYQERVEVGLIRTPLPLPSGYREVGY